MSTSRLSQQQRAFIDSLADLLGAWSMPVNAARLYGYLQIMNEPVGLEDIARDLEISRSHAHSAAKVLEVHGNARGVPTRGSKLVRYVCGDDPGQPLRRQVSTLGRMSELIASKSPDVSLGDAYKRLVRLAKFHRKLQESMQAVIGPGNGQS
jgi:DNA-binding transcriptional regulator GbsR (MarR family)